MSTSNTSLTPAKLSFDMSDSRDLLRYVWSGILLPTTLDAYKARVQMTTDFNSDLQPLVQGVVNEYAVVQKHCQDFKDNQYPQVVSLASDMYSYAKRAGGTIAGSYYANIIKYGQEYYDALQGDDQAEITRAKSVVDALIQKELTNVDALKTKATAVKGILNTFDQNCQQDSQGLATVQAPITSLLAGKDGRIATLTKTLSQDADDLRAASKEYEEAIIIASTSVLYAWVPYAGVIAAGVVIGVYSDKAIKLKNEIDGLQAKIDSENIEMTTDLAIVGQGDLITKDLTAISAQIALAIPAIEHMMGAWDAIAADLTTIRDSINSSDSSEDPILQGIDADNIVAQWNDLATEINSYRTTAYITPTQQTLAQASAQLAAVIQNQPAPN